MWLTSLAIKRPLIVLIAVGALLAFGLLALTRLGVELLPAIDSPVVTVTTPYPGAGPDAVDTLVTRKIEDAVASMNEIDNIQATSLEGLSTVTITFTEKASKDSPQEVERRVNAIRNDLPTDTKTPTVAKDDSNASAVLWLTLGGNRDLGQLQQIAEEAVKKDLEGVSGVARVDVAGGLERQIQIQVDQRKLTAHGLSILQVTQALGADNLNVPAGTVAQRDQDWTVRLSTQAQSVKDLQGILVASTSSGSVRVRDVASVVDTYKEASQLQRTNGTPSVGLIVYKQASASAVSVSDRVNAEITSALASRLPAGVSLGVVGDQAPYIKSSVADVQNELLLAVLLTGLVLLVFLHTFRSTAIVLLAIPTSLISTFGVMLLLGISFNFMSLMGLALTVGILVDDSIVVLENIARHLKLGEGPHEAAINGRSEIGMAAIAITLVDVVVYTPIAFMTGFVGAVFRDFGLVIATATLFSLLVSFTLTPMLASRWFRQGQGGGASHAADSRHPLARFSRIWDVGYQHVEQVYEHVLRASLRVRWLVVGLALASFAGGIALVGLGLISTEFLPQDDGGRVDVSLEMPAGTSLAATGAMAAQVEARLLAVPEVDRVWTSVTPRAADMLVFLKDKKLRQRSSQEVATETRTFGQGLPGATLKAAALGSLGGNGGAGSAIQVQVQGDDQQVLAGLTKQVADVVRKVPGTVDISDGGVVGQPELVVTIDRDRAADLGLTAGQVAGVLRTGLAGSTVGTFRPDGTKGWDVVVILDPEDRARVEQVTDIPVITPHGDSIRLGQVAQVSRVSGPTKVDRRDRQRSFTVSAGVDGRPTGSVAAEVQAGIDKIGVPAGYTISQGGSAKDQHDAFGQIFQALGLSVVLMYLLMALLFESVLFPLVVMLSLPLALVGALGLLALTGNTLNLMSMIGMILLTGLVGKNAILLVDFTNHLRRQGKSRGEALIEAGPTRLRPILMTSAALILAMLPLAARLGDGGEWRAPMAVCVIGGLLSSTFLTLLVIPSVYTLVDDAQVFLASLPGRVRRLAGRRVWRRRAGLMPRPAPTPRLVASAADD